MLLRSLQFTLPLLFTGLVGCSAMTTVKQVQANPQRNWFTAHVSLQGTIGDRVPLIGAQVYQLKDSTGTIWVLTNRREVQSGSKVLIQGKVRFTPIPIEGQEFGEPYIEEQRSEPDNS